MIRFTAAPIPLEPPQAQFSGTPQTYERGDVLWNSEPSAGAPLGKVCINSGTQGTANPASFATFGIVDSPSLACANSTLLTRADRYISVIATGTTITLPAAPIDGQTHAIKCQAATATRAGVSTTVETQDTLKIDGQDSAALNPGEHARFRYSAATGEWEIR
jgi:hypothetical protein